MDAKENINQPDTKTQIVTAMNRPPPPLKQEATIAIKELELKKLSEFLSNPRQKTQLTQDDRVILSALFQLAKNPFRISTETMIDEGIIKEIPDTSIDFIVSFLNDWIEFGLPINRQGRNEDKEVMKAYFAQLNLEDNKPAGLLDSKLLK